jgi:hypothetical protein
MNKITLSDNFFIIVLRYKKDYAAYLFEQELIKAAKIFSIKTEREEIQKWGLKYLNT